VISTLAPAGSNCNLINFLTNLGYLRGRRARTIGRTLESLFSSLWNRRWRHDRWDWDINL